MANQSREREPDAPFLTTMQVARILDRSSETVRTYERSGRLHARKTAGGMRLFREEDVRNFAAILKERSEARAGR